MEQVSYDPNITIKRHHHRKLRTAESVKS